MTTPEPPILRDRVAAALGAETGPVTAAQLATELLPAGHPSAPLQVQRALRQLEAAGGAVRDRGKPWASPDQWRASK